MGSLLGFEILREIRTNWSLVFPLEFDDDDRVPWSSRILPASLRVIKLLDRMGRDLEQYAKLVKGVTHAKRTTCPLLEVLELAVTRAPEMQDLQRACEDAGIAFAVQSDQLLEEI